MPRDAYDEYADAAADGFASAADRQAWLRWRRENPDADEDEEDEETE